MTQDKQSIPLDLFLELAFGAIFSKDTQFVMRPLDDVADDMLRFIRRNVNGQTFRYLVEHGMTAEYVEQWLHQRRQEARKPG